MRWRTGVRSLVDDSRLTKIPPITVVMPSETWTRVIARWVLILAVALEGVPHIRWTAATVGVVAYQIFLGSAFGFWGLLTISRSLPAITTNLTLMAVPVVGLLSSIVIANESLTLAVPISLVLAGVGLGLYSDRRRSDPLPSVP